MQSHSWELLSARLRTDVGGTVAGKKEFLEEREIWMVCRDYVKHKCLFLHDLNMSKTCHQNLLIFDDRTHSHMAATIS